MIEPSSKTVLRDDQRERLSAAVSRLASPDGGAALSVVIDGESTTLVHGTLFPGGPAVTQNTAFSVQSVSKLLTAAKIHSMARAGELSLTDPIKKHLPGVKLLDGSIDRAGELTVASLLNHTAGVAHSVVPADLPGDVDLSDQQAFMKMTRLLTKMTDDWTLPVSAVGSYGYSNKGYLLLGAIIERTADAPFADVMAAFLHEQGLERATFTPTGLDDAAHGKMMMGDKIAYWPPDEYASPIATPYGGLWISLPSLARFGETLARASSDPAAELHGMVQQVGGAKHGYGPTFKQRMSAPSIEHDGRGPGFLAILVTVPSRNATIALAFNGFPEGAPAAAAAEARFGETLDEILATLAR